jgi:membrane protease subunit HflC
MKKLLISLTVVIALLVVFLMMGPFYIVDEGSQVVVTCFGKIIDSHNDAGLYFKMPFVDQVTVYPKRIRSLDGEAYRIPTKENQFIILDATSRCRISEPEKFYQSLKTLDNAYNRLADIVDSATRTAIAITATIIIIGRELARSALFAALSRTTY